MSTIHNINGDLAAATAAIEPVDMVPVWISAAGQSKKVAGAYMNAIPGVAGGSTLSLTLAAHGGKIIKWDTAAGTTLTLPTAAGTGVKFFCIVTVLATSNSHIVQAAGSDLMVGEIMGARTDSGNAVLGFCANGSSHKTITLNRTTTGSVNLGEWVECIDIATNRWFVRGFLTATGAAFATPFS